MFGLDAEKVYAYLDLLAEHFAAVEGELGQTQAHNQHLQGEIRRMRADLDDYEQAGDRVNEQVVQMFSQAQLIAEEMVADVSRDAQERIGHAREHERKIVEEAMSTAGQEVRSYAQSAQAQMQSIMESFATEVNRLGNAQPSGDPADSTDSKQNRADPLSDDVVEVRSDSWRGSRPYSPGPG